jgi:hypothetical protein
MTKKKPKLVCAFVYKCATIHSNTLKQLKKLYFISKLNSRL